MLIKAFVTVSFNWWIEFSGRRHGNISVVVAALCPSSSCTIDSPAVFLYYYRVFIWGTLLLMFEAGQTVGNMNTLTFV